MYSWILFLKLTIFVLILPSTTADSDIFNRRSASRTFQTLTLKPDNLDLGTAAGFAQIGEGDAGPLSTERTCNSPDRMSSCSYQSLIG